MDPAQLGGMLFTLVMVVLIGIFITAFPVLRRLGGLMEESIRERRDARLQQGDVSGVRRELSALATSVQTLERQLEHLGERQEFVEELLERSERAAL
ncbi:MAG: hypothetical protein ACRELC_00965, partial [Gemmatimonadota bacterium]